MSNIGERIKKVRFEENLSQMDFSEIIGIHRGHLSKIENGKMNPTPKTLERIYTYFNVNKEWLQEGKGIMKTAVESEYLSKEEVADFRRKLDRINYHLFSERLQLLSDTISYHAKIFDTQSLDFLRNRFYVNPDDDEAKQLKESFDQLVEEMDFLKAVIGKTLNGPQTPSSKNKNSDDTK